MAEPEGSFPTKRMPRLRQFAAGHRGQFVRLRWAAVLAQATGVAVAVRALGLSLPLLPIAGLIVLLASSNLMLGWWMARGRPAPPRVFGAVLVADVTLPTALLWLTGGTSNPFSTVYLVYIALAAVTLGAQWTWTITAVAVAWYATLCDRAAR